MFPGTDVGIVVVIIVVMVSSYPLGTLIYTTLGHIKWVVEVVVVVSVNEDVALFRMGRGGGVAAPL